MREITWKEWQAAWSEVGPRERYPGRFEPGETVSIGGFVARLPAPLDNTCSPQGLAGLFVGLGGGRKR